MHLKALRTHLRITQQTLAEELSISQQTVARWESEGASIPTKHLKDLALLLGCSISELLGIDSEGKFKDEKKLNKGGYESDSLYGTVSVTFETDVDEVREWPISEGQRMSVLDQIECYTTFDGESLPNGWINFHTLDDRIVFVNSSTLESLTLVSDDVTASPSYEHPEVYRTVKELLYQAWPTASELEKDDSPYTRLIIDKCEALRAEWGGDNVVNERMEMVMIERLNGLKKYLEIEAEGVNEIAVSLMEDYGINLAHRFVNLESDGTYKSSLYRYGALRLIEMSHITWKDLLSQVEEP